MAVNTIGGAANQSNQGLLESSTQVTAGRIDQFSGYVGTYGPKVVRAVLAFLILIFIGKLIAGLVRRNIMKNSTGNDENTKKIANLVRDIVYYVMVGFSIFIAFGIVDLDVGLLLGGVSFGIGLAFKEVLGNMIAGIMILYTKQFRLGDVVEIQTSVGYIGRIEEITIRYTIIRTLDLRQVILPNLTLISTPIKTISAESVVTLTTSASIHYDSDVTAATKIILAAINSCNFVKNQESTQVFIGNFGDSSIDLTMRFGFDPNCGILPDVAIGFVGEIVYKALVANNVVIPYNHMTVHFASENDKIKILQNNSAK